MHGLTYFISFALPSTHHISLWFFILLFSGLLPRDSNKMNKTKMSDFAKKKRQLDLNFDEKLFLYSTSLCEIRKMKKIKEKKSIQNITIKRICICWNVKHKFINHIPTCKRKIIIVQFFHQISWVSCSYFIWKELISSMMEGQKKWKINFWLG